MANTTLPLKAPAGRNEQILAYLNAVAEQNGAIHAAAMNYDSSFTSYTDDMKDPFDKYFQISFTESNLTEIAKNSGKTPEAVLQDIESHLNRVFEHYYTKDAPGEAHARGVIRKQEPYNITQTADGSLKTDTFHEIRIDAMDPGLINRLAKINDPEIYSKVDFSAGYERGK